MSNADRYLDDFAVGDSFQTGEWTVSEDEIRDFARHFDPQGWHLDADAAARSPFKRIVASGWHTTALTMRLLVDSGVMRATGILGTGIDELRWRSPVYPNDTLHAEARVVGVERSPQNPTRGSIRVFIETKNERGDVVLSQIANLLMRTRPKA
jgi:acyl dehydratase